MAEENTAAETVEEKEYDVHIYTMVRVKINNIRAKTQVAAIERAEALAPSFYKLFDREDIDETLEDGAILKEISWAEDHDNFLVDEHGDEEYENSGSYMWDGKTPLCYRDTRVEVFLDNGQIVIHRLPPGVSIKRIQGPLPAVVDGEDPFKDQHESKGPIGKDFERMMAFYREHP